MQYTDMSLIHAGELDSLCCEIEHNLRERQTRQNTSVPSWCQRIERWEEVWEVNRGAIFEHVVRKESLPRQNVLKGTCIYIPFTKYFNVLGLFFVWEKVVHTLFWLWFNSAVVCSLWWCCSQKPPTTWQRNLVSITFRLCTSNYYHLWGNSRVCYHK